MYARPTSTTFTTVATTGARRLLHQSRIAKNISSSLCAEGIVSTHVHLHKHFCCAASCGTCGESERACSHRAGGAKQCCVRSIIENDRECSNKEDTGCLFRNDTLKSPQARPAAADHEMKAVHSIDVVLLWVNGSAPERQRALKRYGHESVAQNSSSPNRWRNWNELYYSVRALRRRAARLGRIFIITGGERPSYADALEPIVWVTHAEFLPAKVTPTFSSPTIEFGLHALLPRLSDPFIEMDDDWIITRPIDLVKYASARTWFEAGHSRIGFGHVMDGNHMKDNWRIRIENSNRALRRVFPHHQPARLPAHVPVVIRHATLEWVWRNLTDAAQRSMTRFRSNDGMQFQYVLSNAERHLSPSETKFKDSRGVMTMIKMSDDLSKLKREFNKNIFSGKCGIFLCLNDDIKTPTSGHKGLIRKALEFIDGAP